VIFFGKGLANEPGRPTGDGRSPAPAVLADQGVQFTAAAFIETLAAQGVQISMDGKGRFLDNIFIERLWRSLKYEEVFIKAYATVAEARQSIGA
jgi:putative transposase